jgi:hypothetical protein
MVFLVVVNVMLNLNGYLGSSDCSSSDDVLVGGGRCEDHCC